MPSSLFLPHVEEVLALSCVSSLGPRFATHGTASGALRNTDVWVPLPEILIWLIWSSAQASVLLRTPRVMLICSQGLGTGPGRREVLEGCHAALFLGVNGMYSRKGTQPRTSSQLGAPSAATLLQVGLAGGCHSGST